jgi:hypothetical protein
VNSKILFCRVHVREGSGLRQPQVPGSNDEPSGLF